MQSPMCSSPSRMGSWYKPPGRAGLQTHSERKAEVLMIKGFGLAALAFISLPLQAQQRPTTTTLADTSMLPPIDPARALEAEVRVALNDLVANRTVSALQRLQWLASVPATSAPMGSTSETPRGRGDMPFLLAQGQDPVGMGHALSADRASGM